MPVEKPLVAFDPRDFEGGVVATTPMFACFLGSDADGQKFVFYSGTPERLVRGRITTAPLGLLTTYRSDVLCAAASEQFAEFLWRYVGLQAELELMDP